MTEETPAQADEPEIPVRLVHLWLCDLCLDGKGGECHSPGCSLWLNRAPDLSLRDTPMVTVLDVEQQSVPLTGETPAQPAPGLVVATFGYDSCLTPDAVYATYIGTERLSVTVDYGRELPISEDEAEDLDARVHRALERELARYWQESAAPEACGGDGCPGCPGCWSPSDTPQPAPELAAAQARLRETAADNIRLRWQLERVREITDGASAGNLANTPRGRLAKAILSQLDGQ